MRNIEIKAKVKNLINLIKRAKIISGSDGVVIQQHDTFFNVPQGRLKLRKFETGCSELIYYERPDVEGPKLSNFIKVELNNDTTPPMLDLLAAAVGTKGAVEKTRHLFLVGQTRVHVDSVKDLGDFMELEVVLRDDQSIQEGEAIAKDLMQQLGVHETDLIANAYIDLLNK